MTETIISGYHARETIGAGKVGTVFQAVRLGGDTPLALKRFDAMAIDRGFLDRTHQRLAEIPRHPGLVEVSDFRFDEPPYFVAMEWIDESSPALGNLPAPMAESEAWPVIYDLADALSHLHRHGVRHGNLHPGNVFFTGGEKSRTRLTDLGSGLTGNFHHLDPAETAWFAPPEQLLRPDCCDGKTMEKWDVYRFGVLAFWLINGDVPRGHHYGERYRRGFTEEDGRQVFCDLEALLNDLREHPDYEWREPAQSRADRLRREIVDRCLAIDPAERPVDMREIWLAFEKLEAQFELEEAQVRVCEERTRQSGRLFFARAVAAALAAGLVTVSGLLFFNLKHSRSLHREVGELSSVVGRQKNTIDDYDRRWTRSLEDLKEFRTAAGSIFSQMSKSGAGNGGIESEVLEKSRAYFERTLGDLGDSSDEQLERAGCLHNLAHVEAQLGNREAARGRYREAAGLFEKIARERPAEESLIAGIEVQLLECYERVADLLEDDPCEERLAVLRRTADLFERNRERRPDEPSLAMRQTVNQLLLGRQLYRHHQYGEAVEILAQAGENASRLREAAPGEPLLADLLSRVQFQAALSLRKAGRDPEAIDSHLAAMETVAGESAEEGQPYTREQRRRLGLGYAHLGELFAAHAESDQTRAHFNEAMRLLSPICEGGAGDPEAAIFLSRVMAHIARLEREASHWTDGYRMSLAAIESLEATLEKNPDDVDCQITLSALRVSHTEILRYNRKAALRCLENGLTMIGTVQEQVEKDGSSMIEPVLAVWQERIANTFDQYRALCESFGESEKAKTCSERATRARRLLVHSPGET